MTEISIPRLLLISGNGRGSGKTTFACSIIRNLGTKFRVIAVKISPHHKFHSEIPKNTGKFIIEEETLRDSGKDSSRMLEAGAYKSFFITADEDQLEEVAEAIDRFSSTDSYVVCESGGLRNYVKPGLFFIINRNVNSELKPSLKQFLKKDHLMIYFDGTRFDFDPDKINIDPVKKQWFIR